MNHASSPSRCGSAFPVGGKYALFSGLSISFSGLVNPASGPAAGGFCPIGTDQSKALRTKAKSLPGTTGRIQSQSYFELVNIRSGSRPLSAKLKLFLSSQMPF